MTTELLCGVLFGRLTRSFEYTDKFEIKLLVASCPIGFGFLMSSSIDGALILRPLFLFALDHLSRKLRLLAEFFDEKFDQNIVKVCKSQDEHPKTITEYWSVIGREN